MDKNYDVAALGELLIDFTESGKSPQGNPMFEANPGGAPCNVLAMLCKLGKACAFVGKVGRDAFGYRLMQECRRAGVDMEGLVMDATVPTTLAFVQRLDNGDRDFSFYRDPGADRMLMQQEVSLPIVEGCRIFHFGSLSMTHDPVRTATRTAVAKARAAGALISFDPNLRPPLWDDLEEAKAQIFWGLSQCDILKISDNELLFMTGQEDFRAGAAMLRRQFPNIRLLNVTAGAQGSYSRYGGIWIHAPGQTLGGVVETTGAGDTFCACVLGYVLDHGLEGLCRENLAEMLAFANTAAYLITTKKGALLSMPERSQVEALLTPPI